MATLGAGQITPTERRGLTDALFLGNLTLDDLNYARRPFNDAYRLPLVNLSLDRPLDAADALLALHEKAGIGSLSAILRLARTDALDQAPAKLLSMPRGLPDPALMELPVGVRAPVETLVGALEDANFCIKSATSKLTAEEKRELIETLPLMANEEPSIAFSFTKRKTFERDRVLALLKKVDVNLIETAAIRLASTVESQIGALKQAGESIKDAFHQKLRIDGLTVDIAGSGDDVYDATDAVLTIDLGGHNRYTGRCGAGVGYAAVGIDLGDGATFDVTDLNVGAGVLGIGLEYVGGSDAVFRGKSLCFGAGLAGVGALMKESGWDSYTAVSLAEGYGEFGIGLLLDTGGNDHYDGNFNVQGAARTGGCGWLVDRKGDDVYHAGGLILNSPLFATVHYSNAQGYASGYREDDGGVSGGVGLLTDLQGDDNYLGETYCQAASYWFSLGSLYDRAGNDTYSAYHYAQASAMHCCGAYLFDLAGDDSYTIKYGAGHAIGHDYGVAMLLDRAGNDVYAAGDSKPGTGNANGLGLLLDSSGDDGYLGFGGVGNAARGAVSLGVFADLGGSNRYADTLIGSFGIVSGSMGIAWDSSGVMEVAPASGEAPAPPLAKPQPGSLARPSDAELERLYRKATQWRVGTATADVDSSLNQLIAIGLPAVEWMTTAHLARADRLQLRAFVAVVNAVGPAAKGFVADRVRSPDNIEATNALRIVTDGVIKEAGAYIPDALKRPALRRTAARAAGAAGSKESVPALIEMTKSGDQIDALAAVVALVQIGDDRAFATGTELLSSREFPVRKAAESLVAKFADRALPMAKTLIAASDETRARTGIEILGLLGDPSSLDAIGLALSDARPGVRVSALVALSGRIPSNLRGSVARLRSDPDPRVRAVASRVEFGR